MFSLSPIFEASLHTTRVVSPSVSPQSIWEILYTRKHLSFL